MGARRRLGLRYVTDDRLAEGTVGSFSVATNLLLKQIGEAPFWLRGIERREAVAAHARTLVATFDVRTPSVETPLARLSGGNIQGHTGARAFWARHALTAAACRAGVTAMGLSLWAAREAIASPTTTAVRVPRGIDDAALRAAVRACYGVAFSSGRGETLGKLVRIGHMGPTARPLYAVMAVTALGGALASFGHPVGAGAAAAMKVIDAAQ